MENKIQLLQEEKDFISKEIKLSMRYNQYLKSKIKELENSQSSEIISNKVSDRIVNTNNIETKTKNEISFANTSRVLKTSNSPNSPHSNNSPGKNKEKDAEKLDLYFSRNEHILTSKISFEEKQIKEKYTKYKMMESLKNPIFNMLNTKAKEYQFNLMNSKVSNQEVFFNVPENDGNKTIKKVKIENKINFNFITATIQKE